MTGLAAGGDTPHTRRKLSHAPLTAARGAARSTLAHLPSVFGVVWEDLVGRQVVDSNQHAPQENRLATFHCVNNCWYDAGSISVHCSDTHVHSLEQHIKGCSSDSSSGRTPHVREGVDTGRPVVSRRQAQGIYRCMKEPDPDPDRLKGNHPARLFAHVVSYYIPSAVCGLSLSFHITVLKVRSATL